MAGPFDTVTLLELRAMVLRRVATPESMTTVINACREARGAYIALPLDASSDASCVVVLRNVWHALSTLSEGHPLYVPPLYESVELGVLLCDLVAKVRRRERSEPQPWTSDHAIVGGIEGTGKSTIIKAIACGIAVCSSTYMLAVCDFSAVSLATWRLSDFVVELALRYTYDDFCGVFGTLGERALGATAAGDMFRSFLEAAASGADRGTLGRCLLLNPSSAVRGAPPGMQFGLCCDEVQLLFVADALLDDPRVRLLQQLQHFARTVPAALLCLTGSSADLRTRLFAYARDGHFSSYADFNKTLCDLFVVPASRTQDELAAYLAVRYRGLPFSDDVVRKILHNTGGIGRLVHAYVTGTMVTRRVTPEANVASGGRDSIVMLVQRMLSLEPVGGRLQQAAVSAEEVLLLPQDVALPLTTALFELESTGFTREAAVVRLQRWADEGLLYQALGAGEVSLARPCDARAYLVGCTTEDFVRGSLADVVGKCINVDSDVPWRVRVAATRDLYVREGDPPTLPETTAEAVVNIYIDDTEVSCIVFSDNEEMALCARAAWTPFCSYYVDIKAAVGNLVRESYARTEVAQAVAATVATAFTVRWVDRCRSSTHELCIYMLSEKDDDMIICYTFGGVVTAQWKSCA